MKSRVAILLAFLSCSACTSPSSGDNQCSGTALTGNWMFATGIGRQSLGEPFPPGKDITAIGTMTIDGDGEIAGRFDATVQDSVFLPANAYTGLLVVNADCTGTLTFVTSQDTQRTDSIVVVNSNEIIGMSRDPANLWTYRARRIGGTGR